MEMLRDLVGGWSALSKEAMEERGRGGGWESEGGWTGNGVSMTLGLEF